MVLRAKREVNNQKVGKIKKCAKKTDLRICVTFFYRPDQNARREKIPNLFPPSELQKVQK